MRRQIPEVREPGINRRDREGHGFGHVVEADKGNALRDGDLHGFEPEEIVARQAVVFALNTSDVSDGAPRNRNCRRERRFFFAPNGAVRMAEACRDISARKSFMPSHLAYESSRQSGSEYSAITMRGEGDIDAATD